MAHSGSIAAPPSVIETHPGQTIPGNLNNENGGDLIAFEVTAGETYTFAYRGTAAGGIVDPWLQLLAGDQSTLIAEDDDGGLGRSSQITYTATATGTVYLRATSWYQIDPTAPDFQDNGNYTIDVWSPEAAHDAGETLATAGTLGLGTSYAYIDDVGDLDLYAIELTAGMVYTFTYNGGVASDSDFDGAAGESLGVLGLYDSEGNGVAGLAVDYETGLTFLAQESGTYYLSADAYSNYDPTVPPMTGGYTLDVREVDLADMDPLESLNWDSANNVPFVNVNGVPTAYVYFAAAGENFGETQGDSDAALISLGWNDYEMQQVMLALEEYEKILGVNYEITTDVNQATFRLITTEDEPYGARFYPQDPAYGTQQGIGTFNVDSGGWGAFPQSLERGGFSFAVILHEFGHAHGIAHPHDNGGGSEIMLGVTASTGSYGIFNLNQGVYTVMSYNDAWDFHPDGPSSFTIAGIDNGWSGSLGAFDIAVLQARYGVHALNTGNNNYALTDVVDDAFYQTIWDTGGTDTISYSGPRNAQIDLTAATLDYSPTGGGVLSFLYNLPGLPGSQEIKGGYTIANGVVIEHATGGSGNDVLIGNAANNTVTGNAGNDVLLGRDGRDLLRGGLGDDVLDGGFGKDEMTGGLGADIFVFEVVDGQDDKIRDFDSGSDRIDLSAYGVDSGDVKLTADSVFVNTDADKAFEVHIIIEGERVQMTDIIFA